MKEHESILTKISDSIKDDLSRVSDGLDAMKGNYSIIPETIPPSVLKKLEIGELADMAYKYGHKDDFTCTCPVCKGLQKMYDRGEL